MNILQEGAIHVDVDYKNEVTGRKENMNTSQQGRIQNDISVVSSNFITTVEQELLFLRKRSSCWEILRRKDLSGKELALGMEYINKYYKEGPEVCSRKIKDSNIFQCSLPSVKI